MNMECNNSMEEVRERIIVVIVDSGVNYQAPIFETDKIQGFTYDHGKVEEDFLDPYGHGTAVYHILRKVKGIEIINVRLKEIEYGVEEEALIGVLEYINETITCNIINLSLGISLCNEYDRFHEVCKKITEKGTLIVASFDNYGSMSYPAAFECVIGVAEGNQCKRITDFEYYNDSIVNLGAKSSIQRVAWTQPPYLLIGGNSFACVHVTNYIANLMKNGWKRKEDILNEIKKNSIYVREAPQVTKNDTKEIQIHKAAIFPWNKEMHSLIRFSDLLSFEIRKIYDVKYSGFIGSTTNHLLKDESVLKRTIENIDHIDWDAFDTFIIGHLEDLVQSIDLHRFMNDLVHAAIEHKKKLYFFDDVSNLITDQTREYINYPLVNQEMLPWHHQGKLYRYSKPVLGVFGTSSKQGKFTLQLTLRKYFLEAGYSLGEIGTEPSSLLFGMDYVYPMGYNSNVYIRGFESILYLNQIVHQLCIKDKDLILVGSQSGTITYDEGNLQQYSIPQYTFLLGTQPDAVILCINPYDELSYILRTIQFIEASVDTKVIAIVVFPMTIKKDWQEIYGNKEKLKDEDYQFLKEELYHKFNRPIFCLGIEEDMRRLFDTVIDYYE